MSKKILLFIFTLTICAIPLSVNALSVDLSLFSGGLSLLDSLLLISVGLILIGILLMCVALLKPVKNIEKQASGDAGDASEEPKAEPEASESLNISVAENTAEALTNDEVSSDEMSETNKTDETDEAAIKNDENDKNEAPEDDSDKADSVEDIDDSVNDKSAEVSDKPSANITLTLTGTKNGELKVLPIHDRAVIGRSMKNDVVITDSTVSGIHCEFIYEDDKVFLSDKNSTNGTYLNNNRIYERTEVHKGDILSIGRNEFKIGM